MSRKNEIAKFRLVGIKGDMMFWILIILGFVFVLGSVFFNAIYFMNNSRSECIPGTINSIEYGGSCKGVYRYHIYVMIQYPHKEFIVSTGDYFALTFFKKERLKKLEQKYIGTKVYVYYNSEKPYQASIKEFMMKRLMHNSYIGILGIVFIVASLFV
ncbi:MAG: hypothetical protein PHN80_07710 [Hespellia sp.]|nr:hypothetical protein [Hespellia sp.]